MNQRAWCSPREPGPWGRFCPQRAHRVAATGEQPNPPGVPGIQIHQRGSSSDPTEDLLRVLLACLEGGFCQAEGARTGWAPGHGGSAPGSALKVSCTPLRKGRHHSVTTFCEVTLGQECRGRLHFVYPGVCLRRQSSQTESPDVPRPQEVRWHVLPRALTTEPLGARTWPPQPRTPCIPALWPGS